MDKQDKFESYILGRMTGPEKTEFEHELENNPLLKEQLELEQNIVGQIRERAFVDKQINRAKQEMKRGKVISLISYSITSIAALFLVLFIVHGVWQGKQCDKLYASNFTTYNNDYLPTDGSYRGDTEIDSLIVKAMLAYEGKDFTTAETQFSQILSTKDNPEIRFYLAIAQLEIGKTEVALNSLQMLYSQPLGFRYFEQLRWYLALANLKLHHKSEAKKYLDELVALDGVYLDKVKKLIENLK